MNKLKQLHLVSHTHWDREWYLPMEVFRYRLVGLLDRLLTTMEEDEAYVFHLDGQAIILSDYAAIRPERMDALRGLVRSGRLAIGPWYVLMDEYLVSGEALIRNLEEGARQCEPFGEPIKLGYLPDLFGHITQMPQLLRQFGMERAVVWRGLNGTPEETPSSFVWESPSGDQIYTIHLPARYGYTSAMELPLDPASAAVRIRELAGEIGRYAHTGHALLMNGFDHMEPQRNLRAIIEHWNRTEQVPLAQTSIMAYIDADQAELAERPVRRGELRRTNHVPGARINAILPNVLSSRVYLKLQNAEAQTRLEKRVEPLQALLSALGGVTDEPFVRLAWRHVLDNHPHDSICGCSIDEVHEEMELRYAKARQISEQLELEALQRLGGRHSRAWMGERAIPVYVFNSLPWRRDALVELELDTDDDQLYRSVQLRDVDGVLTVGEIIAMERICPIQPYSGQYPLSRPETNRYRVKALLRDLPALGGRLLAAELRVEPHLDALPQQTPGRSITNGIVRLTVEADGSITYEDLTDGRRWSGLHLFEEGGDVGDGYSYSQPLLDERYLSGAPSRISSRQDGFGWSELTAEYTLQVPREAGADGRRRSGDSAEMRIVTTIELAAGSRTAVFRTELHNNVRDHRVRLLFRLPKLAAPVAAGSAFDIVSRPDRPQQPSPDVWFENEPTTFPFQQFLYVDGPEGRAVFTANGLHEYEWIPGEQGGAGTLAITLLRAVSHMAAAERGMQTTNRPGPGLRAEGAQCLRTLVYTYSLTMPGLDSGVAPWRIADEQAVAPLVCTLVESTVAEAGIDAAAGAGLNVAALEEDARMAGSDWLSIDADLVQATSLRPLPEPDRHGVALRLANLSEQPVCASIRTRLPVTDAYAGMADGRRLEQLTIADAAEGIEIAIRLEPKRFVTCYLEWKR
ncbi:hypothetical protein PA598K_03566 [Paenibacillus sp. 598K]|uniref:glycoside hydrolase family 38 N-terminal domain-containing protein n=1 Tax=Paenibacillus sp. 598K TaxID=1117987 RepID=UPI000FF9F552|nr:glycoside hydrolase family 38 C-terminal domain-containing protein [Paenibacillus sp. 598K]GBF75180.1 hypothetical protein PA598K_03566 [Paenibacillus sp. 598K]